MDDNVVLFFIGQSVVIVGSILVSFIRTQVAIARLELRAEHIESTVKDLKSERGKLSHKVDGISRHVAALEVAVNNGNERYAS